MKMYLKTPNMEPLFLRLETPIRDFTLCWPRVAAVLQDAVAEGFSSEGTANRHGPWAPLSEKYAKAKALHYPGATILQRDGTLESSFMGGEGFHFVSEPMRMEWGSDLAVGAYHQFGTSKMPARRILDFADSDVRAMRSEIVNWLQEEYRRLGFRIVSLQPTETVRRITRSEASRAGREAFEHGASPI